MRVNGSFFFMSYLVLPADLPEGYHTLKVTVGKRRRRLQPLSALLRKSNCSMI